jgi:hypothetical protein
MTGRTVKPMKEDIQDDGFTDVEFMTAREKAQVFKDWERFIESGFERRHFTGRLYKHLTLHCSFIAHYDIAGFYDVYFGEKRNTDRFIDQFTSGINAEYGMDYWLKGTHEDINNAMCEVMRKYSPDVKKKLAREIEKEDIIIAMELLAKHGRRIEDDDVLGEHE